MLRRLRANGPTVLVPLAWGFVTAAHLDLVAQRTLLIAHVVMGALLLAFVVLSWRDMREGALRVWRRIILAGFVFTVAGAAGLVWSSPRLLWTAVVGWMLLPAAGLWDTGRRSATARASSSPTVRAYFAGGAVSALGAVAYVLGVVVGPVATLAGLLLVGVGQTAGILAAVVAD